MASRKQKKQSAPSDTQSLESIFSRLETIVGSLERGEQPLTESLTLFEEGIHLCQQGTAQLDEAERVIEQLLRDPSTGKEAVAPFTPDAQSPAED